MYWFNFVDIGEGGFACSNQDKSVAPPQISICRRDHRLSLYLFHVSWLIDLSRLCSTGKELLDGLPFGPIEGKLWVNQLRCLLKWTWTALQSEGNLTLMPTIRTRDFFMLWKTCFNHPTTVNSIILSLLKKQKEGYKGACFFSLYMSFCKWWLVRCGLLRCKEKCGPWIFMA